MKLKALIFVLFIVGLSGIVCQAQSRGEKTLQAWLGHDAGELIVKWHIDKGFVQWEDKKTGETAYSWLFGTSAYYKTESIFDGATPVGTASDGSLVMQHNYHDETSYVPAQHFCTVTLFANSQGILTRYTYTGPLCGPYEKGWGKPKEKK